MPFVQASASASSSKARFSKPSLPRNQLEQLLHIYSRIVYLLTFANAIISRCTAKNMDVVMLIEA